MKYLLILLPLLIITSCTETPTEPKPTATPIPAPTATATSSLPQSVYIKSVVCYPTDQESITINNNSGVTQDIGNWTLGDKNNPTSYNIPSGTTILNTQDMIFLHANINFQINDKNESIYLKDSSRTDIDDWTDVPDSSVPDTVYIHSAIASPTDSEEITIKNNMGVSMDISQWTLGDLNEPAAYSIPVSTTILVDEEITYDHTTLGFQINNSGETLYLKDETGQIIDTWSN